ncbi:MAG: pyrimidine dimer DNA glycosylase/endonuclease V [Nitrospiraceae bacterium]|nr:pyrimidine dimer DNA glycosylase/endonuclease V [Nitrospiraceae bacterium]
MRIWDIQPEKLCRNHLLGEHRELHALWTILTQNKKGYSRHPETLRWIGRLKALFKRHELLAEEMKNRGYSHQSGLDRKLARGRGVQDKFLQTKKKQAEILKNKKCGCNV